MKKLTTALALIILLASCISLKEEYPEYKYYRLTQLPSTLEEEDLAPLDASLQVRGFCASEGVNTDHFIAVYDETRMKKYYYHRWIANVADLTTDFLVNRYNQINVFAEGVVKSGSLIMPDYILEGQILDMTAQNDEENEKYSVFIALRITLLKKEHLKTSENIIFNKVFTEKVERKNEEIPSIASAFSKAASKVSDEILLEIIKAVKKAS